MKKLAATSLMALALTMPGNTAQAADLYVEQVRQLVLSGYVEGWVGYSFNSYKDFDDSGSEEANNFNPDHEDYGTSGQGGRLSVPLSDMVSLQSDFYNEITENAFRDDASDDFSHSFDFGIHVSARDPSQGLFGVFAAIGQGKGDDENGRHDYWAVGGEAQLYTDMATFYLQGGYMDSKGHAGDDQDGLHDAFFVRGVARWFMTPDSRLQGEVAYANGTQDECSDCDNSPYDMDVIQWGVRYDTVIGGLPIIGDTAVFVGYRGTHFDNVCCNDSDTGKFTEHTIMAGYTYHFGGMTLLDFDRVGATLDLPTFGRWVAGGEQID